MKKEINKWGEILIVSRNCNFKIDFTIYLIFDCSFY